ncbi:hypothetical protein HDU97_007025 [Phlyctochytrium planicorne]|nr:hypothetical protein HDU97_007025 [Phlyctochytrium planicorne]
MSAEEDCQIVNDFLIDLIGPTSEPRTCCSDTGDSHCIDDNFLVCITCDENGRIVEMSSATTGFAKTSHILKLVNLAELRELDLTGNQIEAIPEAITRLEHLEILRLGENSITVLPEFIGNLTNLTRLRLDDNKLTGQIPRSIGQLQRLRNLNLRGNQLTGPIPDELGYIQTLETLFLDGNTFNSSIPETFGNLTKLRTFMAAGAFITGNLLKTPPGTAAESDEYNPVIMFVNIPMSIKLYVRDLSQNQITGRISDDWSKAVCPNCNIHLENNRLTGDIPSTVLAAAKAITWNAIQIDLRFNYLSGPAFSNNVFSDSSFISFDYTSRVAADFNCFKWPVIDIVRKKTSRNRTQQECEEFLGTGPPSTTVALPSTQIPLSKATNVNPGMPTKNHFISNTVNVPNGQVTTLTVSRFRPSSRITSSIGITETVIPQQTDSPIGSDGNPVNLVVLVGTSIAICLATVVAAFAMGLIYGRKARTKLERVASSSSSHLEQSQTGRTSQDGSVSSNPQASSAVSELQRREILVTSPIPFGQVVEHQDLFYYPLEDSEDEAPKDREGEAKPRDLKKENEE